MKHIKNYEAIGFPPIRRNSSDSADESVIKLVEDLMESMKIDADAVRENDPEIFNYLGDMILDWKYQRGQFSNNEK